MEEKNVMYSCPFHVELKNGHFFDFLGGDRRLQNDHIIITLNGEFIAAFDLSEVAFAAKVRMVSNDGLHIAEYVKTSVPLREEPFQDKT